MPFTLSQLKSQDLRDIDNFYVQNNIGNLNNANAQVLEGRSTLLPENDEEVRPARHKHKKKNKAHDAYLCANVEDAGNSFLDKTFVLNDANDVRIKNAERICSYPAFSSGEEEDNDLFKTSTQASTYRAFSSGMKEDNDLLKTSTQVSAENIENCIDELKIKKKHKKNRHKENEFENSNENFLTKKEKNKTKLKSVVDVKLQEDNECVFQDSESSCVTEDSSKSKKKKKKRKSLENGYALNNYFLENDRSVSSIDSISTSVKSKRKQKGNINYDHDNFINTLEFLNTTDVSKPKKRKLQSISEDDLENHFTTAASIENTEKLNDFVMPKKLKLEEDNTFSTDSELLDSYLYFSYKNKQPKKKQKERIQSIPMPIVIKTENDLDEEEQSLKDAMRYSPVHSDQSIGCTTKKHKKKKHEDYLVEKDRTDTHDEAKIINTKHKKKHKEQVLEDELKGKDTDSEQITSNNSEIYENAKYVTETEEKQLIKNAMRDSPVHSDQSIGSTSKKHKKKKHKDCLVEKDKSDSHDEPKIINKKHKKKHKQVLEDELKNTVTDSEQVMMPLVNKTENDLDEVHSDRSIGSTSKKHKKKKYKDYSVEKDKSNSHDEAENTNKKHKKKHKQVLEGDLRSKDANSEQIPSSINEIYENMKLEMKKDEDEEQQVNELKNSTMIPRVKKKQRNKDVTNMAQENDESYLTFKNVLLDTEAPPQTCDVNGEVTNLGSDRESKKHKKKSKDHELCVKYPEVTSVDEGKGIAEAEYLVEKIESVSDECGKQKLKRKHMKTKASKVKVEDGEQKSDTISEPFKNPEVDESSSSDGPDDRHYIRKRNGRIEICNFKGGTGLFKIEDTGTDRFEINAIIKRRSDLYQLQENNDVRNDSLNRKVCDDVVNTFKEKLASILNHCSKQICSESMKALDIDTLLSLRVNLTFTQTSNNIQGKVDCCKSEKLLECECEELKIEHDNEVQDCVKVNCNENNENLFECKESKNVSLNTVIIQDNIVQECTTVNCCKSIPSPDYEESKVTSPTNRAIQFDDCINKSAEIETSVAAIDCKDNPETAMNDYEESKVTSPTNRATEFDDCINKSAEIEKSAAAIDCKNNPETALECCASNEISPKLTEDLIVCTTPCNENVKIIQNVKLTESEAVTYLQANNNTEMINSKETMLPLISDIESQLESITEEDIMLIAEGLSYVNANNHIPASNGEVDGIMKSSEIQATNSEHCSDVSSVSHNSCTKQLTIFDEDTVILSLNKIKSLRKEETDAAFMGISKENDESTSMITKEVEECSRLSFKSFFNNDSAKIDTQKERTREADCQKQFIFGKEPEHLSTENVTENSSTVNNKSKASNESDQNEIRGSKDDSKFMKDLNMSFEDLDPSFFLSDSDCDTEKEPLGKSSSKFISPNLTDLYNRLMCDTSIDGDDTTTADDIINEALGNALESTIHLVEEYQFLKDLAIHISWEIPLAHTIETRMSSQPSPSQKQKFKELNVPLKLGPYTKEEDKKILSNFEEFCKVHDIPNDTKPFLNFKHGRQTLLNVKQRINFVQYLGKGLECRMLHSIYRRFVCLCTEKKKGRFTKEEDAIIQEYINNKRNEYDNKKFSTLSTILNRHRLAVEKRYKYLISKQKLRKDNYKIKKHIPEYLKHLMEILEVNEVSQLKDMKITRNVWLKLADKIGESEIRMKRLWETIIYPRLFAKDPIDRDGLMKQVILKLIKLKKTDYRDVNWCEMASEFDNVTPAYLYQMFRCLIGTHVPERKRHDLSSTLKHLARAYKECDCIMKKQSKMEFENGEVSFIRDS